MNETAEAAMKKSNKSEGQNQDNLPNDSINANVTAKPQSSNPILSNDTDPDAITGTLDYGKMNLHDAQESGYTDKEGHAISKAKKDVPGSPTGAYTDVGAGRSSVVHHHGADKKTNHEKH